MRYFELGLGNSVEEDWETFDYSMCSQNFLILLDL